MHGKSWARVAQAVKTRNGDQCLKRWGHALDPGLDHRCWSEEEDLVLGDAVERLGNHWAQICASYFPGRSALTIRRRHQVLENRNSAVSRRLDSGPFLFVEKSGAPPMAGYIDKH